ncbi:MAG: glycine zipper family protein [Pseudomonadota bacterium]
MRNKHAIVLALAAGLTVSGCAGTGADRDTAVRTGTGAATGAAVGAVIGAFSGSPGAGAAIGSAVGGGAGFLYDQVKKDGGL